MEQKVMLKYVVLLFIVVVVQVKDSNGCLENERLALLDIKASFSSYYNNIYFSLPSWEGTDCCNWERVKCNSTTGHVVELLLDNYDYFIEQHLLNNYHYFTDRNHFLNASLFQSFSELKCLNLSFQWFFGFASNKAFEEISNLKNLETLDLKENQFNNYIFSSLSQLVSLKKLILGGNDLGGTIPTQDIAKMINLEVLDLGGNRYFDGVIPLQGLKNLRVLDLSWNYFIGTLPIQGFEEYSSMMKLETLNLKHNRFNNSIFSSLSAFASLKKLILGSNDLRGSIPTQDIAKMKNLEVLDLSQNQFFDGAIPLKDLKNLRALDLSRNNFNGTPPLQGLCEANNLVELDISLNHIIGQFPSQCLENLTSLRFLDISLNQFSGKIPTTIANLTSLVLLNLTGNYFEGSFSFSTLANLTKLKVFHLSTRNSTNFQVETERSEWLPTFQLKSLAIVNCNLNSQTTSRIPTFLLSQHDLEFLDLSHNKLVGSFPLWLLQSNSKLKCLYLIDNSFTGALQLPTFKLGLLLLEISHNNFSGQLPNNMGFLLPNIKLLNFSRNGFEGSLPSSMEEMKDLHVLDLSNNNFSGKILMSMFNNKPHLCRLLLGNNSFSGSIEDGKTNGTRLEVLDVSNNVISGKIPSWIGSFKQLRYLQISKNLLEGELPVEICSLQNLQILDVSQNQFLGYVPSCFNFPSLIFLYMQENHLSGPIPDILARSSKLEVLDLSYNNFLGHIPSWINRLTSIRVLLLKGNRLDGPIPQQLCQARNMSILDLSSNKFSASIPSCLSNMSFGKIDGSLYSHIQIEFMYFISTDDSQTDVSLEFFNLEEPRYIMIEEQCEVDFTAKSRLESYKGNVLKSMSGLDLSCNDLSGQIPLQIGDLQKIRSLNFSHNNLTGVIPMTFSKLKELENLDLSYNFLSGNIPTQLGELNFLQVFNVSYNNLSGMIPTSPHFQTFDASSYFGNLLLCGPQVEKVCSNIMQPTNNQPNKQDEDQVVIDLVAFCWSFAASYITILLGFAMVLYINPYWRNMWFYYIDVCHSYISHYFTKLQSFC